MSIPLAPVSLVAGQTFSLRLTTPNLTKALLLANKSVFDLQVIGAEYAGSASWLASGVEDLYIPRAGVTGEVDIVVVDYRAVGSPTPNSASLLVTQYTSVDAMPEGVYPCSIPIQGAKLVADQLSNENNPAG